MKAVTAKDVFISRMAQKFKASEYFSLVSQDLLNRMLTVDLKGISFQLNYRCRTRRERD